MLRSTLYFHRGAQNAFVLRIGFEISWLLSRSRKVCHQLIQQSSRDWSSSCIACCSNRLSGGQAMKRFVRADPSQNTYINTSTHTHSCGQGLCTHPHIVQQPNLMHRPLICVNHVLPHNNAQGICQYAELNRNSLLHKAKEFGRV